MKNMKIVILLVISATLIFTASSFEQKDIAESTRNSEDKAVEEANNKPQETPRRPIRCRQYSRGSIKKILERQNLRAFGIRLIRVSGKLLKILKAKKTITRPIRRYYHHRKQLRQRMPMCKEDPADVITLASEKGRLAYTFKSVSCSSQKDCTFHGAAIGRCEPHNFFFTVQVLRRRRGSPCRSFGADTIPFTCACRCYKF